MAAEIAEQIDLLRPAAARYKSQLMDRFGEQSFDCILLAARGSSDHAALYARYLIEVFLGIPGILAAPSVLTRFGVHVRYPKCLCVGISQSGAAPDVSEVLSAARADGHSTLAITNTANSKITEAAEASLLMGVGPERSLAATKTYTASLLALAMLVEALGGQFPEIMVPDLSWLAACQEIARAEASAVVERFPSFALGRGFGFATAQEAALKLMECALVPCKGYSAADFQHGPRALAGPESVAIIFGEPPVGLRDQGCHLIVCPTPECPEPFQPIWQAIFAQCLALEVALAKGLEPDKPPYLRKITKTF